MTIAFKPETLKEFDALLARYPQKRAALLPALRLLERDFGCVSEDGMAYVAGLLGIPPAHVYGVVTFYTHLRRSTDGKVVFQVCSTLPCALRGSEKTHDALCAKLGIKSGETTPDGRFTVKKVECLADCDKAPVLQCNDDFAEYVTPEVLDALIERYSK